MTPRPRREQLGILPAADAAASVLHLTFGFDVHPVLSSLIPNPSSEMLKATTYATGVPRQHFVRVPKLQYHSLATSQDEIHVWVRVCLVSLEEALGLGLLL